MHRGVDRATRRETAFVIEPQRDLLADGLLARVELHVGLIDINMMSDAIVIPDAHPRAWHDAQRIRGVKRRPR